jgi:hypothetical protein
LRGGDSRSRGRQISITDWLSVGGKKLKILKSGLLVARSVRSLFVSRSELGGCSSDAPRRNAEFRQRFSLSLHDVRTRLRPQIRGA